MFRRLFLFVCAYFFFRFLEIPVVGFFAIVGVGTCLGKVRLFKIVLTVYTPAVQNADSDCVLGATECATCAHDALAGKMELVLFLVVSYVLHGAVVDALHATNTLVGHLEAHSVYFHCGMFDAQCPRHNAPQKRTFKQAVRAGENLFHVYRNKFLRSMLHFLRLLVGVAENHVVRHDIVIFVGKP